MFIAGAFEWFLISLLVLALSYLLLRRLSVWLWNGQQAKYQIRRDDRRMQIQLQALNLCFSQSFKLQHIHISNLQLSWTPPWKPRPPKGAARLEIIGHGVDVALRYNTAVASDTAGFPVTILWSGLSSLRYAVLALVINLLSRLPPADLIINDLQAAYEVRGVYSSRLMTERLVGSGRLTACGLASSFQRAQGTLHLAGVRVARFDATAPTFSMRYIRRKGQELCVDTQRCVTKPCIQDIHAAVSPTEPASAVTPKKPAVTKAGKEGFQAVSQTFSFRYSAAALAAAATELSVSYGDDSVPPPPPPPATASDSRAYDVMAASAASYIQQKAGWVGSITPVHVARLSVRLMYSSSSSSIGSGSGSGSGSGIHNGGGDGSSSATGTAADLASLQGVPSPASKTQQEAEYAAAPCSPVAPPQQPQQPPSPPSPGSGTDESFSIIDPHEAEGSSGSGKTESPAKAAASAADGDAWWRPLSADGDVLIVEVEDVAASVRQNDPTFRSMSGAAERMGHDMKQLLASAVAQSQADKQGAGAASTSSSSTAGGTAVAAKVDGASIQIDGSTAKVATVVYSDSAGAHAAHIDVSVLLLQLVPVVACHMDALTHRTEGCISVEGLKLDAGRIGPVMLFSLVAQGMGFTSSTQEVSLAQWASKLAGIRVGGGDAWTGTVDSEESEEGQKRPRISRRVVVPPGIAVQQVYRSAAAPTQQQAAAIAQNFGLVRLRPLDLKAVKSGNAEEAARRKLPLPPPAGFGLDLLPGFKHGFRYDFAVQPLVMPKPPATDIGSIISAVFRR